jgi:hypothetical protein
MHISPNLPCRGTFARTILVMAVVALTVGLCSAAQAAGPTFARSQNVALVPDDGFDGDGGTLPTFGTVIGRDDESFDEFDFSDLAISDISTSTLASFDTVVLNQVSTADLDSDARQALAAFVSGGGKLLIHDADGTVDNDYSWLPAPASTGESCTNCGEIGGSASVVENNSMVSANPADASYVDVAELPGDTDAVGDANVMLSQDEHWFKDIVATNANGETGAVDTYASVNGLIVYNGFDTDDIGQAEASGVDWLAHMWWRELAQAWSPDGLPHGTPLNCSNVIGAINVASGVVPEAGKPGTTVTITGKSYCPGTTVEFGNSSAIVTASVQNTGQMTATVPRAATSGSLQLIDPDGQIGAGAPFSVDSYRNTNGFQFGNDTGVGKDFGFDDVAAAFGDNAWVTWTTCKTYCSTMRAPSDEALAVQQLGATLDGMCFGFALGSLRLSQGLDPRNSSVSPRVDPAWTQPSTWALPPYETNGGAPYGTQMRHYLYQQQIRQFSTQYVNGVNAYAAGLKSAPNKGAYLLGQVRSAIAGGMALIGMTYRYHDGTKWWSLGLLHKNVSEGHELVAFDVEPHPDGSFEIDVYDGNQPWTTGELASAAAHDDMLRHNQIHVASNGTWTYDGDFGGSGGKHWSGGPDDLQPVAFSRVRGALNPWASSSSSEVAAGAPVGQLTDDAGHTLYDDQGDLVDSDTRADAVVMAIADTNTTSGGSAPPVLLLNPARSYSELLGPGSQQLSAPGIAGQISTTNGGQAHLSPDAGELEVAPATGGPVSLTLSRTVGGTQSTVSVSGTASGSLSLTMGSSVTVSSAKSQTLNLTVARVGPGEPPSTFTSHVRVAAGQHLELGSRRKLNPSDDTLTVKLTGGHTRSRTLRLANRAHRPTLKVARVTARHGRKTVVAISLSVRGGTGGEVAVTVASGGRSRTVQIAAHAHATARVDVGRTRASDRLRVWAVAIDAHGQSSRTVKISGRVS